MSKPSASGNYRHQKPAAAAAGQAYKLTVANAGVSAVPVPGAVWLFGSALAGYIGLQRRKSAS